MAETESDYRVHLRSCSHPCALWPLGEGWQPLGEKGYKCYYLADWGPLCSHRLTGWMTLENRLTPSISSVFFLWPSRSPGHTLQCLLGVLSDPITMQSSWVSTGGCGAMLELGPQQLLRQFPELPFSWEETSGVRSQTRRRN